MQTNDLSQRFLKDLIVEVIIFMDQPIVADWLEMCAVIINGGSKDFTCLSDVMAVMLLALSSNPYMHAHTQLKLCCTSRSLVSLASAKPEISQQSRQRPAEVTEQDWLRRLENRHTLCSPPTSVPMRGRQPETRIDCTVRGYVYIYDTQGEHCKAHSLSLQLRWMSYFLTIRRQ